MDRPKVIPEGFIFEPKTCYLVEVSWFKGNPLHRAILYSGFLYKGYPSGYHQIWHPTYDSPKEFSCNPDVVLRVVKKLDINFD